MTRWLIPFLLVALILISPQSEAAPLPLDSLANDEAAIAVHIKKLYAETSEVRATAAKALRLLVEKYPSRSVYLRKKDAGEAYWADKIKQVEPGLRRAAVLKMLPPFPEASDSSNMASGQRNWDVYRLDYHWTIQVLYDNPDKVSRRPTLIRDALHLHVEAPKNFTGSWVTWHVNGQKGRETQYQNGKYHGVQTSYYDKGQPATEQQYKHHVADGPSVGWHRDAAKSYTGQYRQGKQDGKWLHWHANGLPQSEATYVNGVYDGRYAYWHENGQITSLNFYRNGVKHGLEAAWDPDGVLQYRRTYDNGSIVDP